MVVALGAWLLGGQEERTGPVLRPAEPGPGAMPVAFEAPRFSFADQDGKAVGKDDLRGKVWVADFIFTHCGSTCPKMTANRAVLQKRIADPRVTFVSFTVDPERDDAATRKEYAGKNGLDESRWRFVAPPDRAAAFRIAEAMKIAGHAGANDNPVLHSDRFVLVDDRGRVRDTYLMSDAASMDRLVRDATALADGIGRN